MDRADLLILDAADRLSAMGAKVSAFAITSSLLLIFACLEQLSKWLKSEWPGFMIGLVISCIIYVAAVWVLFVLERQTRTRVASESFSHVIDITRRVAVWL